MQTCGADSKHKLSEIECFSTLNEWIISQNSKDSVTVNCQWVQWPALISHCNLSSVVQQQWGDDVYVQMQYKQNMH